MVPQHQQLRLAAQVLGCLQLDGPAADAHLQHACEVRWKLFSVGWVQTVIANIGLVGQHGSTANHRCTCLNGCDIFPVVESREVLHHALNLRTNVSKSSEVIMIIRRLSVVA